MDDGFHGPGIGFKSLLGLMKLEVGIEDGLNGRQIRRGVSCM